MLLVYILAISMWTVHAQVPFYFGSRSGFKTIRQQHQQLQLQPDGQLIPQSTTEAPAPYTVYVNNRPVVAAPITFLMPTTPTPEFLQCFGNCPTTSEYNPVCANNQQLYLNEQKFNCARNCGANIEIVRRGSCEGLFPMSRG